MMIGSNAKEDKCRQCRGNGTHCHTSTGIIDSNDLRKGYNDVLLIPEGATSIVIYEVRESNNYLAIRSKIKDKYYLNGGYRIDFPRSIVIAGTLWHYERSPQGFAAPDKLTTLGPTTEPLYLSLLLVDDNVGVQYEYSLPTALAPRPHQQYNWVHGEFTPCSASCGGGFQTRNVSCRSRDELDEVKDNLCDEGLKPPTNQSCNTEVCPAHWVEGPWSNCSKPCGEDGTRSRQVRCEQVISNGHSSIVDDKECIELHGRKPARFEECNKNATCPTWFKGPWKACDKLCGEGKQTRQVVCHRRVNGRVEVFGDEECPEEKPPAEQPCILHLCVAVDWVLSNWTGCDTCSSKNRTRVAQCVTENRQVVDPSMCSYHQMPVLEEPCDKDKLPDCEVQWYATQWSKCTKVCGGGEQKRAIMCLRGNKESKDCAEDSIPENWRSCNEQPCDEDQMLPLNTKSTPIMDDDYILGECIEYEKDYEEEGAEVIDDTLPSNELDVMFSDSPVLEGSGGWTAFTEIESEFTTEEGSGADISVTEVTVTLSEFTTDTNTDESTDITIASTTLTNTNKPSEHTTETETNTDETTESTEESTTVTNTNNNAESTIYSSTTDIATKSTIDSTTGTNIVQYSESTTGTNTDNVTEINLDSTTETITDESTESSVEPTTGTNIEITIVSTTETNTDEFSDSTVETTTDTATDTTLESTTTTNNDNGTESTIDSTTETNTDETTESTVETTTDNTTEISIESTTGTNNDNETESTIDSTTATNTGESFESTIESTTRTNTDESYESTIESTTGTNGENASESTFESTKGTNTDNGTESTIESTTETSTDSTIDSTIKFTTGANTDDETESSLDSTTGTNTDKSSQSTVESTTDSSTETTIESTTGMNTDESTSGTTDVGLQTGSTEIGTEIVSTTDAGFSSTESSTITEAETTQTGTSEYAETSSTESNEPTSLTQESTTEAQLDWKSTVEVYTQRQKCKIRRKIAKCTDIRIYPYGCCPDKRTPAKGPFDLGCKNITTCADTKYGCCPDGVSPALDDKGAGCPVTPCNETLYGCCKSDNITAATGNDDEGCPVIPACKTTEFGCCENETISASGPNKQGCPETEVTTTEGTTEYSESSTTSTETLTTDSSTSFTDLEAETTTVVYTESTTDVTTDDCTASEYGCCLDNITEASGPNGQGCPCSISEFGCCPDNVTAAIGPNLKGCGCITSKFGCCLDGDTPAHGPDLEGCCAQSPFGCCPDNYKAAEGPHLEGCSCQTAHFGCCPDNVTIARGPNNEGCGCHYTEYGCCPDRHTAATGYNYEGCGCHTYQFGCCPDGVTISSGPGLAGCLCQHSPFKCCGDEVTAATGPDGAGCNCANSKYGCCPDGTTAAAGPKFLNCTNIPINRQEACSLPKDSGEYNTNVIDRAVVTTKKWYYDMTYGGCAPFWYLGFKGNANRFSTQEECQDVCVHPAPRDACKLPSSKGSCTGYNVKWYYDSNQERCAKFIYGGCLGNDNRFDSEELCQASCRPEKTEEQCKQPIEQGSCAGSYLRWGFNPETRKCSQFIWGGCEGNANRFNSEAACMMQCNAPGVPQARCKLPGPVVGTSTGKYPMWSFKQTENRCVPFYYTGDGGNDNMFESEQDCVEACPSAYVPDVCTLPAHPGDCDRYETRWFFDTKLTRCRQFYYGGCGGNENNFATEAECENRCSEEAAVTTTVQPTNRYWNDYCVPEADPGPCTQFEEMWAFSVTSGTCKRFRFGGCGGNNNRFPDLKTCLSICAPDQEVCQQPMQAGPCQGSFMKWFFDAATGSCS
ncbi:papilin-like [Leptidea sinapis]|uniref:papilin-like n=1 Tax=Leptidea sinapis TaxID=189913 RepID=UPI0021C32C05|nr:papilin-like [Leptidea sinapis]